MKNIEEIIELPVLENEKKKTHFCNICDNHKGGALGCRILPSGHQKLILSRGYCFFGKVCGEDVKHVTAEYIETAERIRYSRSDDSLLKHLMETERRGKNIRKLEVKY